MKRIRATFLLRCVVLAASVCLFVASFWLLQSIGMRMGTAIFLLVFWFVGIEANLLPTVLAWLLCRQAAREQDPVDNLWFVDRDREKQEELDEHTRGSANNPTIR
jgi:hypothetical protein